MYRLFAQRLTQILNSQSRGVAGFVGGYQRGQFLNLYFEIMLELLKHFDRFGIVRGNVAGELFNFFPRIKKLLYDLIQLRLLVIGVC